MFIASSVAWTISGAVLAAVPSPGDIQAVKFQAVYFDEDQNSISSEYLPETILFKIRLIPGSTFGKVTAPPITSIPVRIGETATLDLEVIRRKVERSAAALTREASSGGLSIVPSETRIARLGTFAYGAESARGMASGFRTERGERLYVVYFDRPCALTGVRHERGITATYDVKVSTPGFNWLKVAQETPTSIRITLLASPVPVVLGLLPFGENREDTTAKARFYVTPTTRKTFTPRNVIPVGTVFHIKVLKKAQNDSIHLQRCGVPCDTAVEVKTWEPESYGAGDELSWRIDRIGEYYFWIRDRKTGAAIVASADAPAGDKLRITFESGAVLEAWYVRPQAVQPGR